MNVKFKRKDLYLGKNNANCQYQKSGTGRSRFIYFYHRHHRIIDIIVFAAISNVSEPEIQASFCFPHQEIGNKKERIKIMHTFIKVVVLAKKIECKREFIVMNGMTLLQKTEIFFHSLSFFIKNVLFYFIYRRHKIILQRGIKMKGGKATKIRKLENQYSERVRTIYLYAHCIS